MKKIFTFLVAFLTTVSGAVWGIERGSLDAPFDISNDALLIDLDDCTGEYYITTNGQVNTRGIKVGGSRDATNPANVKIYLINTKFDVGGSAIVIGTGETPLVGGDITRYVNLELVLIGENKITSDGTAAAIKIGANNSGANATLTISDESTGSLDIQMAESDAEEMVAIGNTGAGGNRTISGTLTVNGGTITTNGNLGAFDTRGYFMNGNGIVVADDIYTRGDNWQVTSGIYYETEEKGQNALNVVGNVTINSPIPDENIYIGTGNSLTLGEGDVLDESRVKIDGGTLNAYKVSYDLNKPADMTSVTPGIVNSKYYGPNTALEEITPTIDPETSYYYWGWANNASLINKTGQETPTGISNIDAKAVWVVQNKTITAKEGTAISDFYLVSPQTVTGIEFTPAEGTTLPNDIKNKDNNKISGTLNASGITKYTASDDATSKTVTLTFNVVKEPIDLGGKDDEGNALYEIRGVTDLVYNGQEQTQKDLKVYDVKNKGNLNDTHYTVSYGDGAVKNVGEYTVIVTGTGAYSGTLSATFDITKAEAKVTAEDVEWTIGDGEGPDFSKALSATGVGEDELTVASFTQPIGPWTTAGVYKVTYRDIKLSGDLAGNYNEVADVEGTLTVKKNGGGEGGEEINPGDPDGEDTEIIPGTDTDQDGWEWVADKNRYERTYDGESHLLSTISLKYKNKEGKTAWETLSSDEFSVKYSSTPVKDVVAAGYTATITITGSKYYSGTATMTLYINPRPMEIDINKLTAEDVADITAATEITISEADVDFEKFDPEKESGIVAEEESDAKVSGKIIVAPAESTEEGKKAYTITVEKDDFTLSGVEGGKFTATNYKATYTYNGNSIEDGTITDIIDDITPGEDTDIDDGDGDDSNWEWNTDANAYVVIYDGKGHGVATITVDGDKVQPTKVTYKDADGVELLNKELPTDAGRYTAEVEVTIGEESKTKIFPLCIEKRPLGVHFNLDDYILEAGGVYDASSVVEYEPVVIENVLVGGKLAEEDPVLEGTIKVADTPNSEDKYAVTFEGVKLGTDEDFDAENYEPTYYLNGELLELDENGDKTVGGEKDPEQGIDISEPDDETGISSIGTKRYRLYLANKDYNVADAKADYAAEGLELFSRHDKKYTKAGGSFTVWYEKDGVANAGGYRIFWSNRANGDYKEVKFDTVSEYFQIRNVQSNVYVKIYAADGFPVGNEEISAADYRAYAQPNKIVVITPQPTDVQIISMAGAVVATDKVTGQREFANLTEGVYIVRMGETVVKLQVRK